MTSSFEQILPEQIFDATETLGGRCTGRFMALNAMENRVYDVEREDGTHVVIKFYRPGRWEAATIRAEHAFLLAAAADEIPVVCPLADAKGETLFSIMEIFFTIFPKRPGRLEPELNKAQLERLGRYLGRLHNVGAARAGTARGKLSPETYGRDALKLLLDRDLLPPEAKGHFVRLVGELCDRIEPHFVGVNSTLVHGDCHVGNILWNRDEPYFIDFDDMLFAPEVQDIWMLTGGDDEYGDKQREILLEAYEEIRPFDHATLKLIEPLRALRMINFIAWIAKRWEDGAFKRGFPQFGSSRYWQEQIEGLAHQLEKVKALGSDQPSWQ